MSTVEFRGETYRVAETIGLAPLIRFGKLAKMGSDSADMTALAVMYDVLDQCFAATCGACGSWDQAALLTKDDASKCCPKRDVVTAEFDRFMDNATAGRWDHEEILEVVGKVMEVLAERPTGRPSASSAGRPSTPENFEAASSLRAQRRLEEAGRADLAVAVLNRREYLQAARQTG
jgi:hypothetical protein